VFDGARAFEGTAPDLDLHFERIGRSARAMFLNPVVSPEMWADLTQQGLAHFDKKAELYIRPMYWAERNGSTAIAPDPDSTCWCLCLYELPMPGEAGGLSITLSPFRRPTMECMPTNAKAACLYPNNARAVLEAKSRGFDNALLRDMLGNVAETASSNIFMARDGVVLTPAPNDTFLNGITRQRVIKLLRDDGVTVLETTLTYRDFEQADEVFTSGNYAKVQPVTRIDDRALQPGRFYRKARDLYWSFAHEGG
jgi:branched-chain amino acid aminotransferase